MSADEAVVTLNLADLGQDPESGVALTMALTYPEEQHAITGRMIKADTMESAQTDNDGMAQVSVIKTDQYILGRGRYTLTVGTFLEIEDLDVDWTTRSVLEIIQAVSPPSEGIPGGQLGWIKRRSTDDAPTTGADGVGDMVVDTGTLRIWDGTAAAFVDVGGTSNAITEVSPTDLDGVDSTAAADQGKAVIIKADDPSKFDLSAVPMIPGAATTSVDGLMSSEDKTKLDGVATGAEVNVNADWDSSAGDSEILNKPAIVDVEANPSDAATQTLSKLKVGSTAYNVPSGSGGGNVGTAVPPETLTFDTVALADDETGERFELADAGNSVGSIVTALRSDQDGFTVAAGSYRVGIMAEPSTTSERFYPAVAIHTASTFDVTSDTPLAVSSGTYFRGNSGHRVASFLADLYLSAATEVYLFAFQQEADTAPQQVGEAGSLTSVKVTFSPSGGLRGIQGPPPTLSNADPLVAGTAAAGSSANASRADHVHPKQAVAWDDVSAKPSFAPATAEANVQSDWNQATDTQDDYIKNKPTIPTIPGVATTAANGLMSSGDKTKLNAIASGAEVNVQSDWTQTTNTSDDYIKNKPTIPVVEANPSDAATVALTKIKVGTTTYSAPTGSGTGTGNDELLRQVVAEVQRVDGLRSLTAEGTAAWTAWSTDLLRIASAPANEDDYEDVSWRKGRFTPTSGQTLYVEIDAALERTLYAIHRPNVNNSRRTVSALTAVTSWDNIPDNKLIYSFGIVNSAVAHEVLRYTGDFDLEDDAVGLDQLSATGTKDATTFLRGDNTFAAPPSGSSDVDIPPAAAVAGSYQQLPASAPLATLGGWTRMHRFTAEQLARVDMMSLGSDLLQSIKVSDLKTLTQQDLNSRNAAGPAYEGTNFRLGLVGNDLYVYNNLRANAIAPGPWLWEVVDFDADAPPRRIILAPESNDASGVHAFTAVDRMVEAMDVLIEDLSLPVGTEFYTVQRGNNSGTRSRSRHWLVTGDPEILLVSERTATASLFFYDNTFESTVAENYEVDFTSLDHEASQVYPKYVAFGQSSGTGPDIHTVLAGNFGAAVERGDYILLEARGTWPAGVDNGPELSLEDSNGAVISSGTHVLTGENQYFVIPVATAPASATVNLRLSYRKNRDQTGSLLRVWIEGYAVFRQSTVGAVEAAQAAQEWMRPALADRSWRGEYESSANYKQYDFVNYVSKIYRADVDNPVGSPRATSSHWTQVSSGTGSAAYTGVWNAAAMYAIGQMVLYDDHLYICADPSGPTTTTPDGNPNEWDEVSDWHGTWADGPYSPGSIVIHNSLHYLCVSTTQAGDGNPATDTSSWIELDNPEVAAWALIGSSSRIPWSKLPTSGPSFSYNSDTVTLVWNSSGLVVMPKATASSAGTMSSAQATKLAGIATGAEVNVKANWSETDSTSDAFIRNKPTLAPSTAEANVQADWDETTTTSDAFILNKPSVFEAHVPHWSRGDYVVGDLVKTGTPPVVFMCKADRNNTDHDSGPNGDSEGWIAVSTHRGDYVSSTYYGVGQTVFYTSKLFICLEAVTPAMNSAPGTSQPDADHWMQLTPPGPADAVPPAADDSAGAVGTSVQFAREDHKHPKQAVAWDDVTGKPAFAGEANVQADWSETDTSDDSYILNKPTIPTIPGNATQSAAGLMGSSDKTKLDGIATGAEVNVKSDWDSTSGDSQILNKPTIPTIPAAATTSADGLMASTDKARLDSLSGMAVNPRGEWVGGTAYVRGDVVYINASASTFICHTDVPSANRSLSPAVDADPDQGSQQYWQYHVQISLTRQSEGVVRIRMDGFTGPSEGRQVVMGFLHWRSTWTRSAFYVPGAVVKRSGTKYVCGYSHRADATGVDVNGPGTGSSWTTYWDEF